MHYNPGFLCQPIVEKIIWYRAVENRQNYCYKGYSEGNSVKISVMDNGGIPPEKINMILNEDSSKPFKYRPRMWRSELDAVMIVTA